MPDDNDKTTPRHGVEVNGVVIMLEKTGPVDKSIEEKKAELFNEKY